MDFDAEELELYLHNYSALPRLVIADYGHQPCGESAKKLLFLREAQYKIQGKWLGYLLSVKTEPPQGFEHEKGLKAYAETDRAWLHLISETRLRGEASWMLDFGSALHLWYCSLFEAEFTSLQEIGLLDKKSSSFPSKSSWVKDQVQMLRLISGDLEPEKSDMKIVWEDGEVVSLTEALNTTILTIAENECRFQYQYLRPYLKAKQSAMWTIRDDRNIKSLSVDQKGRSVFDPTKRGRKLGS
jgi:hypothetical protein